MFLFFPSYSTTTTPSSFSSSSSYFFLSSTSYFSRTLNNRYIKISWSDDNAFLNSTRTTKIDAANSESITKGLLYVEGPVRTRHNASVNYMYSVSFFFHPFYSLFYGLYKTFIEFSIERHFLSFFFFFFFSFSVYL